MMKDYEQIGILEVVYIMKNLQKALLIFYFFLAINVNFNFLKREV